MDLKLLAAYALFDIRTINHSNLERAAQRRLTTSTKSRFGVFVSLQRNVNANPNHERQLHGCLGDWNKRYQSMTPAELITKIQQLVQDVRTKDNRRLHFETDVDQDASATLEINFMNLPLREIDNFSPETQHRYSNTNQGLLVDSGNGKRATYLPGMFPNASWYYIAQSLREKAGIGRSSAARFYAYTTTTMLFQIYSTLFSVESARYLRADVAYFYSKHYEQFFPVEYNAATDEARVDMNEAVRNVACIGDVIGLARDYPQTFEIKPVLSNLEHYYQLWLKNPDEYRQAAIFMIRAYHRWGVHQQRIHAMFAAIKLNALEPKIEMGEAVSVLAQVATEYQIKTLENALEWMRERAQDMFYAPTTPLDNVFELNWQSQSVRQMFKRKPNADHVNHAKLLFRVFMKTENRTILRLESLETNYLAVIYECLSNLEALIDSDELRNQRLRYFAALVQMRRGKHGLYYNKDRLHARLDLTGHVIAMDT
jgi:AMMECR1 domain-containing protein